VNRKQILLSAVERTMEQYILGLDDPEIFQLYQRLPSGKRLRAKLIIKIAGNGMKVIKTAAIVEMIHAASLLHDDVIDDADMRRRKPSLNALYGNKPAIMFGDILYSKAFFELADIDRRVARVISGAVVQLSQGELSDVALSQKFNTDQQKYMRMIYQKTASLIEASAEAAALLADKDPKPYRVYGRNLGLAFQMIDDLLDITSDALTLGKPALHDFAEGKCTLPYIYLYEALDGSDQVKLRSLHATQLTGSQQQWIMQMMHRHHIIPKCFAQARSLIDESISLMNDAGEGALSKIAREMIEREY